MSGVYLDYNATARVRPEAAAAVIGALEAGGNPSSTHAAGRRARAMVDGARRAVASLVGVRPEAVTFVSGGTEANALAIDSAVAAGFTSLIVGATEHDAVGAAALASGCEISAWPVDASGVADLDWLATRLNLVDRPLVCLMLANNETGVVQPVAAAAALVHAAGGWLHVDAVQAAGKIAVDIRALGADSLALSAHKLGGPQGAGAAVVGDRGRLSPRLRGGGQERGLRAGTENVPGLAGFGAAAGACAKDFGSITDQAAWRDELAERLSGAGAEVLGASAPRLSQTLCIATPGFAADLQVIALDLAGVMISAGAACSSGKLRPSQVVSAMGRPDLAPFAVRISGGWASTRADWKRCGEAWMEAFERQSSRRREYA